MLRVGPSISGNPRQWKALFGLLSAAAVVAPAAGLAILGVKSNRAERETARQSAVSQNAKEARFVAGKVEEQVNATLDMIAELFTTPNLDAEAVRARIAKYPLAEHVFRVGAGGELAWPPANAVPVPTSNEGVPARASDDAPGAGGDYAQLGLSYARVNDEEKQLERARAAEHACGVAACKPASAIYLRLASGDGEPAAQAVLGLARLELAAGRAAGARVRYAELARRFGARHDGEGISYALLADLGDVRAGAPIETEIALYRGLLAGKYEAPAPALEAFAAATRARLLAEKLTDAGAAEVTALERRARTLQDDARFAGTMIGEAADLARAAANEPQARRAATEPGGLIVYRKVAGGVIGFAASREAVRRVAEGALAGEIDSHNLPGDTVLRVDEGIAVEDAPDLLASEPVRLLQPVRVSLLGDTGAADRSAQAQLVRYLALVGSLIALMVVGVVATYRGAARERELGKLKSDFVSTVSHELKTPLTSIRMFGEMLRDGIAGDDADRQRRYQDVIVRESERLGRLIANVLDFSQIERGARRYDRRPIAAAALAEEAAETYRRLADGKEYAVTLTVDDGAASVLVSADREAIVQSILNLLSNATKYGGKGSDVLVRVGADAMSATIAVVDHGPGIAPGDLKRVFNEFYRAPEARSSGVEGTGLGLALVKRHVEAHDGAVKVASELGQGSTFTIVLPRAPEERTS